MAKWLTRVPKEVKPKETDTSLDHARETPTQMLRSRTFKLRTIIAADFDRSGISDNLLLVML
jgi:hypothetical protein